METKYPVCPPWMLKLHLGSIWVWWKFRKETPAQRKERIDEARSRLREAWVRCKEEFKDTRRQKSTWKFAKTLIG